MSFFAPSPDVAHPAIFDVVCANDPAELDSRSRVSDRLPGSSRHYRYRLQDRALWHMHFSSPIFSIGIRSAGSIVVVHGTSRFATEVAMDGGQADVFAFSAPLEGSMTLIQRNEATTGTASRGLACRFGPDARLVTSDNSVRTNVFVKAAEVEHALEHILDRRLVTPLEIRPSLDWSCGLATSLKFQLDFIVREFARPDGVADNAVALASTTDLLIALILRGAPHNHADQLQLGPGGAVPVYVRRAEEFMRVHGAAPIRISDIATAAGCSVRTLGSVFQRFRGRTPLAALQACRLEQVRAELCRGNADASIGAVARRYGFTNASRFTIAFRRRFGEAPSDIARRASRL